MILLYHWSIFFGENAAALFFFQQTSGFLMFFILI